MILIKKKCRFCDSENTKKKFLSFNTHGKNIISNKEKFEINECLDCKCLFISDIKIDKQYYKKYYKPDYYQENKNNSILGKIWIFLYNNFLNKKERIILGCFKNKKTALSILDIGCGSGNFLLSLDNKKFKKNGLEINPQGAKICKEKGIRTYNKDINFIDFGEKKFDVITLWHVIEHLENPIEMFKKIKEILSDNGILVFQIPNNESFGFKYGKEYWFHLDSPRHLAIPNKKTIEKICNNYGLKIIKVKNEFYDYPLDLFWSVRKSLIKILIYPIYLIVKILSKETLTFIIKK